MMEQRATTVEKALEFAEQKAEGIQGKLDETEIKITETTSLVFVWDKELADLKSMVKARKQTYYNKGFRDAENSAGLVVFQAQMFEFVKVGWPQ